MHTRRQSNHGRAKICDDDRSGPGNHGKADSQDYSQDYSRKSGSAPVEACSTSIWAFCSLPA